VKGAKERKGICRAQPASPADGWFCGIVGSPEEQLVNPVRSSAGEALMMAGRALSTWPRNERQALGERLSGE
jgi:hypothetical protein